MFREALMWLLLTGIMFLFDYLNSLLSSGLMLL